MKLTIAWESLKSRKQSVLLTFLSLLISISVLLSVEHLRSQVKDSFNRTVSGVDLIVGAPSGQLNLLLYSVFRMGSPTGNLKYSSFETLAANRNVDWIIPISLGDSHRGFRVVGTSDAYFEHFKYGNRQALSFAEGGKFNSLFDTVIGYDVAQKLGYKIGDEIVIAHGIGAVSFAMHDNQKFVVAGILAPTGTPVDKSVHVTLEGIEAIHLSPKQLTALLQSDLDEQAIIKALQPDQVTALMVGLKSRMATFTLQRQVNNFADDRLMAILPGVALTELWQIVANVENLLRVISGLVLLSSLFGLAVMLLSSMRERQREISVLRIIGATPGVIFFLIVLEALMLTTLSLLASVALVSVLLESGSAWLASHYGLFLQGSIVTKQTLALGALILVAAFLTALLPATNAYRRALSTSLQN